MRRQRGRANDADVQAAAKHKSFLWSVDQRARMFCYWLGDDFIRQTRLPKQIGGKKMTHLQQLDPARNIKQAEQKTLNSGRRPAPVIKHAK